MNLATLSFGDITGFRTVVSVCLSVWCLAYAQLLRVTRQHGMDEAQSKLADGRCQSAGMTSSDVGCCKLRKGLIGVCCLSVMVVWCSFCHAFVRSTHVHTCTLV